MDDLQRRSGGSGFSNPLVLLEFIEILFFYHAKGAPMIRLDAIASLEGVMGLPCIHLEKTHLVVKLLRALIDSYNLDLYLLRKPTFRTRTTSRTSETVGTRRTWCTTSPLSPLVLHSCVFGSAETLKRWAASLPREQKGTYFLNFLASHDGIGITPGYDWIPEADIATLEQTIIDRGGLISYKTVGDGKIAYEYNINYFSAVADPDLDESLRIECFLTAQAVMLELAGVPGIYIHSLLGSENWKEGPKRDGHNRAINREKLLVDEVVRNLSNEGVAGAIHQRFTRMIRARKKCRCFHPEAAQEVVESPKEIFALFLAPPKAARYCA